MNVIPARVAGVNKVIMATPPGKEGKINPAILVAAREAGVSNIQDRRSTSYLLLLLNRVCTKGRQDFGPGNIYVTTAKRLVYGYCDIDMFAGPSEIVVVADDSANPEYVAADLLSQAEHDALSSSILITT